eukprot:GHVP01028273.1.p1 GENE.GHVP01028273.1~~GHVP01028273.1.p1  ORF type:complete len:351 (-),score=42.89 GHVP01028273.1:1237-2289(-)
MKKLDVKNLLFLFPFLGGATVVLLSSMNGEISKIIKSSLWSSAINKLLGFVFTSTILLGQTLYLVHKKQKIPWTAGFVTIGSAIKSHWASIFVLCGAFSDGLYTFCSVQFPLKIGSAVFFVMVVTGQVVMSVLVDLTGVMWNKKSRVSLYAWVGLFCVVIGAIIFQLEEILQSNFEFGIVILSFFAGGIRVTTAAFNRKMQSYLQMLMATASWIFGSSFLLLIIPSAIVNRNPEFRAIQPSDWWLFFGFLFAVFSSLVNTTIPRKIGYSANYGWTICGQLFSSLAVDAFGFLQEESTPITSYRVIGLIASFTGVLMMQVGRGITDNIQIAGDLIIEPRAEPAPESNHPVL